MAGKQPLDAPVPALVGPGTLTYKYVTDDEPYSLPDDDGTPCVVLDMAPEPVGADGTWTVPGVIALFVCNLTNPPTPTFHLLTPTDAPESPRKDGEGITVTDPYTGTKVFYVFNRRFVPTVNPGDPWKGCRTLAWSSALP